MKLNFRNKKLIDWMIINNPCSNSDYIFGSGPWVRHYPKDSREWEPKRFPKLVSLPCGNNYNMIYKKQ